MFSRKNFYKTVPNTGDIANQTTQLYLISCLFLTNTTLDQSEIIFLRVKPQKIYIKKQTNIKEINISLYSTF